MHQLEHAGMLLVYLGYTTPGTQKARNSLVHPASGLFAAFVLCYPSGGRMSKTPVNTLLILATSSLLQRLS